MKQAEDCAFVVALAVFAAMRALTAVRLRPDRKLGNNQ
jgi:hypothetical protein